MAQVSSFFSSKGQLKGFWEEQNNSKRKYKPGFLKAAKMSRMIDVFGEEIDMTVEQKGRKLEPLHAKCKMPTESKEKGPIEALGDINGVKQLGFDPEGDPEPRDLKTFTPQLKTLSDFDNLYLGWMENYTFNNEKQKTLVKKAMRALFRFVFGTKAIQELQNTKDPRKLAEIVRQVPLSPEEKAPCLNPKDKLWIWFKRSIEYRLQGLKCETVAASEALNREHQANPSALQNFFVKDLSVFYLNLYRFNEYLQRNNEGKEARPCLDYTEPARGMGVEPVLEDDDYKRILGVFEEFLQDKYGKNKLYRAGDEADMKALTSKFSDRSFQVKKNALETYKAIVALLQTSSVKSMKQEIEELKDETNMQELYSNILSMMLDSMQEEEQLRKTFEQFTTGLPVGSKKRELWERVFGAKMSELDEKNRLLGALLRQKEAEYAKNNKTSVKGDDFLKQFVERYASLREFMSKMGGKLTGDPLIGGGSSTHEKNASFPNEDDAAYFPAVFGEIQKLIEMVNGDRGKAIIPHFLEKHPKVLDKLAEAIEALQAELKAEKGKAAAAASSSSAAASGLSAAAEADLRADLAAAQADLATARSAKLSVDTTLANLTAEKNRLAAANPLLEAAKNEAEAALRAAKLKHADAMARLTEANDSAIATKQRDLDAATAEVLRLRSLLKAEQTAAAGNKAAATAKIAALEKERDDALKSQGELSGELEAVKAKAAKVEELTNKLAEANKKLARTQKELLDAQTNAATTASAAEKRIAEIEAAKRTEIAEAQVSAAKDAAAKIKEAEEKAAADIAKIQEQADLDKAAAEEAVREAKETASAASEKVEELNRQLTAIANQLSEVEGDNISEKIASLLKAQTELLALQKKVAEKDATLLANEEQIGKLTDKVKDLEKAIAEANAAKDAAEAAQKAAEVAKRSELVTAQKALEDAKAEAGREKAELELVNKVAIAFIQNTLKSKIAGLQAQLSTSNASLKEEKQQFEAKKLEFQAQIDDLKAELDKAAKNLQQVLEEHQRILSLKDGEIKNLGIRASTAESKTNEKEAEIAKLKVQIASLESEEEPNKKELAKLRGYLATLEEEKQAAEIRHGKEMFDQTRLSSITIGKRDSDIAALRRELDAERAKSDGQQATARNVAIARAAQATAESQLAAAEAKVNILTAQLEALQSRQTSEEHPFEIPTSAIVPTSISQKDSTAASSMGRSGSGSGELPSSSSASSTSSGSSWTDSGKKFLIKGNEFEHILLLGYNYRDEIPPGIKTKEDAISLVGGTNGIFQQKIKTDFNILNSIIKQENKDNIIEKLKGKLHIINVSGATSLTEPILNFVLKSIIEDDNIKNKNIQINLRGGTVKPTKDNIINYLNNSIYPVKGKSETYTAFQQRQTVHSEAESFFLNLHKKIKEVYGEIKNESSKPLYIKKYMGGGINEYMPTFGGGGGSTRQTPSAKPLCELMLTYLFLQAKQSFPDFDAQEFLDKAGATLDDLGQCPLVLKVLNELLDAATEAHASNDINGPSFYNMNKAPLIDKADMVEAAINSRFSEEDKQVLAAMANPMTFYSKAPEEYEPILGTSPYFLTGQPEKELEEVELYGLDTEDPGPITLTKEERAALEQDGQGVPLGALLFLYLQCLRDLQESGETPALNSKCPLLPNPKRSLSRSRTPKAKSKAKGPGTRKQTSR